jgi:hypothetical protein
MGTFMAVAQGSDEPLKFLEIEYTSATRLTEAPVVLVFLSYMRHLFYRRKNAHAYVVLVSCGMPLWMLKSAGA